MKATELRIGNLVLVENDMWTSAKGIPLDINSISEHYNKLFPKSTHAISLNATSGLPAISQLNEFIEPIPLTEEWLTKFRFEPVNILHDGTKVFKAKPYFYFKDGIGRISINTPDIKYVHSLQNLYYTLTGEELAYK